MTTILPDSLENPDYWNHRALRLMGQLFLSSTPSVEMVNVVVESLKEEASRERACCIVLALNEKLVLDDPDPNPVDLGYNMAIDDVVKALERGSN